MKNKSWGSWYLQIACLAAFLLRSFGSHRTHFSKPGLTVLVALLLTSERYFISGGVANRVPSSEAVGGVQQEGGSPNAGRRAAKWVDKLAAKTTQRGFFISFGLLLL